MKAQELDERLRFVREQIAAACQAAGRSPETVTLVAVSKTQPPDLVVAAWRAGQTDFGENRPEEAVEKITAVSAKLPVAPVRWHMIGHIQSRKARLVLSRFVLIHSVDSLRLASKLSRLAQDAGETLDILLEMNTSGEASKYGWPVAGWEGSATLRQALWEDVRQIQTLPGIRVRGLMTMAPIVTDAEQARPIFAGLRRLRDALAESFPQVDWSQLSMGMTDDYPVAISEGATIVRIGRAIFGPRL
ncbi:MAG: YggS family pyridoxal phosphate-dependent enzyme [Anaerolineae bacterium]|nr:YggS family pyridoxal phosphate-dependent enzyme [Anaerolineae bacterium]